MQKFSVTIAADVRGYAEVTIDAETVGDAIDKAEAMASDNTDCPTMLPFTFGDGEIKGDVSILAAPEGESADDEWHDVPTWGGMPRYANLLAERDRLKAYVESMARMTTPEDEIADMIREYGAGCLLHPEWEDETPSDETFFYEMDSIERQAGEYATFMSMVCDARKLLNGEATADTGHVAPAAPTPHSVCVQTIDCRDGTIVSAFTTEEAARADLAKWCRDNWWPETDHTELDDDETIETYFNGNDDDFYTIDCIKVEG